jgi:hypothetical protein
MTMNSRILRLLAPLAVVPLLAGCDAAKSSNPLSPSVAGPIPGVQISAPKPLDPIANESVPSDKQPITLLIENSSSTGQRPLSYHVEVGADSGFSTMVFTKDSIAPGDNGRTSVRLPDKLASDRTYFWRARAQDGANTGPFSDPVKFSVITPIEIGAPTPISPVGGQVAASNPPQLRFKNANRTGPVGTIRYRVEVSTNDSFTANVYTEEDGETPNQTQFTPHSPLADGTTFFWRARAFDPSNTGPWSVTSYFKTAAAAPPPVDGGGGGGGGGGTGGSCASKNGDFIVKCVADKYPSRLAAGVSSSQRTSNLQFLRDRIIEAGLCGGLDLGWNLKRGGPAISTDFITERVGGTVLGHDFAFDADNTSTPLQLYWGGGTFPSYTKYTNAYTCN